MQILLISHPMELDEKFRALWITNTLPLCLKINHTNLSRKRPNRDHELLADLDANSSQKPKSQFTITQSEAKVVELYGTQTMLNTIYINLRV